jgi:predicted small metal-binding protein
MRRWDCLEVDCGFSVTELSEEELVASAQTHVREAHGSIELEEVILAGAEEVRDADH